MDFFGEYEPNTTPYTLLVYTPRKPLSWFRAFLARGNASSKDYVPGRDFKILPDPSHYSPFFGPYSLDTMKTEKIKIKIKSHRFPAEMRCQHLQGKSTECNMGCYFLEKPVKEFSFKCKRSDCQGHLFGGKTMKNEKGVACFGKRGKRLVTIVPNAATNTINSWDNMISLLRVLKDLNIDIPALECKADSESMKTLVNDNAELSPGQLRGDSEYIQTPMSENAQLSLDQLSVIIVQMRAMQQEIEKRNVEIGAIKQCLDLAILLQRECT